MEDKLTFNEYNDALKENKILGLKCQDCGFITVPPKMVCRKCTSSNMEVVEMKTTGKIQTYTTVNVASEGREDEVPYIIVIVELDDGPWIMGNLGDIDATQATMELGGKKVKMGHQVFAGDKYSAGESTRPLFSLTS